MLERTRQRLSARCVSVLTGALLFAPGNAWAAMRKPPVFSPLRGREARLDDSPLLTAWAARAAAEQPASQPSAGNKAGEVVNAIPDEVVDRPGASGTPLQMSDAIYWQDVVRTLEQGRVRIKLLDSSLLNIGARSSMKIIQHDPQTQQTQLELAFGHLRGEVKTVTKSGGKFEIQTPTAVIGVVGTVLDVEASEDATHVHVLRGKVRVQSRDPKSRRSVIVREGDETHVARTGPPARPTHSPEYKAERKEAQEQRKQEQKELKQQAQEKQQINPQHDQQKRQRQRVKKREERPGDRRPGLPLTPNVKQPPLPTGRK